VFPFYASRELSPLAYFFPFSLSFLSFSRRKDSAISALVSFFPEPEDVPAANPEGEPEGLSEGLPPVGIRFQAAIS
jgi:hypothetical protein